MATIWQTVTKYLQTVRKPDQTVLSLRAYSGPLTANDLFGQSITSAGTYVSETTALNLSAVWCAVRNIAGTVGTLPLILYRRLGEDGRERFYDHTLYRVLRDQPHPEMTAATFWTTLESHVLLWGNGYAEILRDGAGRVRALALLTPERVRPRRDERTGELYYDVSNTTKPATRLRPDEILHVKGLTHDGTIGYSVIARARQGLGISMATEQFGAQLFGKGPQWAGILQHPKSMRPETRAALRADLKGLAPGDWPMLEEGIEWKQTGMPADDAQFLETRQFQVVEVARWFNIPPHKLKDLERATFCMPADVLISTETGPRPIDSIAVGERVWSRDGDRWVLAEVVKSGCTGADEILEIKAGLRTLRCTANHRIPVRRQTLVPFERGKGNRVVIDGVRYRRAREVVMIPAGEIQVGDELLAAQGLPDDGVTSCPTRAIVTEAFMEVLGFYLGDGFSFPGGFGFSHAQDADYLTHYVEAVRQEFIADRGHHSANGARPVRAKLRDPNTTVFYSTSARRELDALGITGTAHTKRVPSWVFALTHPLKRAFLRGYLDADGTVRPTGQIHYVSVNRALLDAVRHLCFEVGLRVANAGSSSTTNTFPGKKAHRLHRLYRVVATNPELNATLIGTYTSAYQRRWDALRRRARKTRIWPCEASTRGDLLPGIALTRVRAVRRIGTEPVFNLTVAGTHTFIGDGTLVKNSNIEEQGLDYLTDTIRPELENIAQEVNTKLIAPPERRIQYAEHLVDALLRGRAIDRATVYDMGIKNGSLSLNEARARENMNAIPGGDNHFVPLNMVPLDRVDEVIDAQTAPKPAPAPRPDPAPDAEDDRVASFLAELRERIIAAIPEPAPRVDYAEMIRVVIEDLRTEVVKVIPAPLEPMVLPDVSAFAEGLREEIVKAFPPIVEAERPPDEPDPEPAPEPEPEPELVTRRHAAIVTSHRLVVSEAVRRMFVREKERAKAATKSPERMRAWVGEFYERHSEALRGALIPGIGAHLAYMGGERETDATVRHLVELWCEESKRQIHALLDRQPTDLSAEVEAMLVRWEAERLHGIPDAIMQEEMIGHG